MRPQSVSLPVHEVPGRAGLSTCGAAIDQCRDRLITLQRDFDSYVEERFYRPLKNALVKRGDE